MRQIAFFLFLLLLSLVSGTALADDIQCLEVNGFIQCRMQIPEFVNSIRGTLTNGWENRLAFNIYLLDASGVTIQESQLKATQRCYIDPFESPCLLLWAGASTWLTYADDVHFLNALSRLRMRVFKLNHLEPGNYRVQVVIRLNMVTEKQANNLRNWLKSSGQEDPTSVGKNTSTLLGNFMDAFTQISEGASEAMTTISTMPFYIDLSMSDNFNIYNVRKNEINH